MELRILSRVFVFLVGVFLATGAFAAPGQYSATGNGRTFNGFALVFPIPGPATSPASVISHAERTACAFQSDIRFFTEGPCQYRNDFFGSKDSVAAVAGPLADDMPDFKRVQCVRGRLKGYMQLFGK